MNAKRNREIKDIENSSLNKAIKELAAILEIECIELEEWVRSFPQVPTQDFLLLLRLAQRHTLNPLLGEIVLEEHELGNRQAFISIDGWYQILNKQPTYQGVSFSTSEEFKDGIPAWMECSIYRSDRIQPITVREYFSEVQTKHVVWQKLPRRMLRHRTLQQCARMAFGIHIPEYFKSTKIPTSDMATGSTFTSPRFIQQIPAQNRIELVKAVLTQEASLDGR